MYSCHGFTEKFTSRDFVIPVLCGARLLAGSGADAGGAAGCASTDSIRGHLQYDLRAPEGRTEIVWPPEPDVPRYRYLGELFGEPNFVKNNQAEGTMQTVFKWLVGLYEDYQPVMLRRPQHGAVADDGRIYVADSEAHDIKVFDASGKLVRFRSAYKWRNFG